MSAALRVPAQRTNIDHEELRAALSGAWRELLGADAPSDAVAILLAHSALETGRWDGAMNFNLGGIKATPTEPHTCYATRERFSREKALALAAATSPSAPCKLATPDKGAAVLDVIVEPPNPMCRFRAYPDLESSALDYLGLLTRKYPAAIERAKRGDALGFVDALRANGYFTGDATKYRNSVASLFDEFREPCLSTPDEEKAALARLGFSDVRTFQRARGLIPDGVVGARTRAKMRAQLRPY